MTVPKSYATPDEPHAALVAERDRLASLLLAVRAEAQPALTYPDQGAQHVAHAVMAATEGVCWASGLTIERCSDGVCDCGYEGWGRRTREAEAEAGQLQAELTARDAAIVALAERWEGDQRPPWTWAAGQLRAIIDGGGDWGGCHAATDGDCDWSRCPQLRDREPAKSRRHCPLDQRDDEPSAS